jgi:hypothetical protein
MAGGVTAIRVEPSRFADGRAWVTGVCRELVRKVSRLACGARFSEDFRRSEDLWG